MSNVHTASLSCPVSFCKPHTSAKPILIPSADPDFLLTSQQMAKLNSQCNSPPTVLRTGLRPRSVGLHMKWLKQCEKAFFLPCFILTDTRLIVTCSDTLHWGVLSATFLNILKSFSYMLNAHSHT